jgi:hypothetical protein
MNILKKCKTENCNTCSVDDFYKIKNGEEIKYSSRCKECTKKQNKEYSKNNPEIIKNIRKKYNTNNVDKITEYSKNYDSRESQKKFYLKNKQKYFNYKKNRRKNDPIFALTENVRKRIYNCLKNSSIPQKNKYLGCEISDYVVYLENQFNDNMNWNNYGTYWEVDHIQSLYTFDFSIEENIYKAFHFTNTRPLSISENRSRPKKIKI